MTSGCFDHSAIWSRTKICRRNRSSLVCGSAIKSGSVTVDMVELSQEGSTHDLAQTAHQLGRLLGPEPFSLHPKSLDDTRRNLAFARDSGDVTASSPAVNDDLPIFVVDEPD